MMTTIQQIISTVTIWLLVAGCRPPDDAGNTARQRPGTRPATALAATTMETSPMAAASPSELDAMIAKTGSVTFRSFNGKWVGMDGDTELTFLPRGVLHMFEYGVAVSGYHGNYTIDSGGRVTARFPTFGHAWPVMSLRKDATSLLLVPVQDEELFVMGNRGGATFLEGQGTYWPFRPLNPAEEARIRESIRK